MKIDKTLIGKKVRIIDPAYCVRNSLTIGDTGKVIATGHHEDFYKEPTITVTLDDCGGTYCMFEDTFEMVVPEKSKFGKHLPTDATERKSIPLYSGLMKYFPDALVEVARLSKIGSDQHNPGEKLRWAREKSTDQEDTLMRHLLESGTVDTDGVRHSIKVCWRALAIAQLELEAARETEKNAETQK